MNVLKRNISTHVELYYPKSYRSLLLVKNETVLLHSALLDLYTEMYNAGQMRFFRCAIFFQKRNCDWGEILTGACTYGLMATRGLELYGSNTNSLASLTLRN